VLLPLIAAPIALSTTAAGAATTPTPAPSPTPCPAEPSGLAGLLGGVTCLLTGTVNGVVPPVVSGVTGALPSVVAGLTGPGALPSAVADLTTALSNTVAALTGKLNTTLPPVTTAVGGTVDNLLTGTAANPPAVTTPGVTDSGSKASSVTPGSTRTQLPAVTDPALVSAVGATAPTSHTVAHAVAPVTAALSEPEPLATVLTQGVAPSLDGSYGTAAHPGGVGAAVRPASYDVPPALDALAGAAGALALAGTVSAWRRRGVATPI
jgi:hypothetical protein